MKGKIALFLISLVVFAGLLYLSDINKVVLILSKANLNYIFIGAVFWFLSLCTRTVRWHYLLRRLGITPPLSITARVYLAGMAVSNLTPGKTGDPIRSVLLKKSQNEQVGKSLSSIFVERVIEIVVMVSISLVGMVLFMAKVSSMSIWLVLAASVFLGLSAVGIFVFASEKRAHSFISKFCSLFSFIPIIKSLGGRAQHFSHEIHKSMLEFKDMRTIAIAVVLTFFIWVFEGIIFYLSFLSLGVEVSLVSAITILPIATFIGVLSFLPGSLGSFELINVMFFTQLYQITLPEVTAAILVNRFLVFWPYIILGFIFLSSLKYEHKL